MQCYAADRYVRDSSSGEYGSEDGSNYANAFDGFADVTGLTSADRLYVCGLIRETLTPDTGYTIDFNCPDEPGQISGADIVTSFGSVDGNGEYPTTADFTLPYTVLRNGVALTHGTEGSLSADEWAFKGSTTNKVLVGFDPSSYTIEIGVRTTCINATDIDGLDIVGKDDTSSPDCYGTAYGNNGGSGTGVKLDGVTNGTVTDMVIYDNRGGIDVRGPASNITISGNTVTLNTDGIDNNDAVDGAPANILVKNNAVTGVYPNKTSVVSGVASTHGITLDGECIAGTDAGNDYRIINNTVTACNVGIVIQIESAKHTTGLDIIGNTISVTADEGMKFAAATNDSARFTGRMIGNLVYDIGVTSDTGSAYAAACQTHPTASTASVCVIENNTLWNVSNGIFLTEEVSVTLRNNLVNERTGAQYSGSRYQLNSAGLNNLSYLNASNNMYYPEGVVTGVGWRAAGGAYRTTFSDFQSDSGTDTNSTQDDPTLGSDYEPDAGSSAIDAGAHTGRCRVVGGGKCLGAPDIGAYQDQSVPYGYTMKPKKRR